MQSALYRCPKDETEMRVRLYRNEVADSKATCVECSGWMTLLKVEDVPFDGPSPIPNSQTF